MFFFSFLIFDVIGASIAVICNMCKISPIMHFLLGFIPFCCCRGLAAQFLMQNLHRDMCKEERKK
jgi:hypothetical protein